MGGAFTLLAREDASHGDAARTPVRFPRLTARFRAATLK